MSMVALDASGSQAGLALLDQQGEIKGRWHAPLRPGLIETLPLLLKEAATGQNITDVAVGIGPGSFTGLRTSIALAQGFAAGLGATLWGIPAWEAYLEALPKIDSPLWVIIRARRGRLFLLRNDGKPEAFADNDLPISSEPIAIAGDEAEMAAAFLAARGAKTTLTNVRLPDVVCIGKAALRHKQAQDTPGMAFPLYVDPPEAKLPAAGLRPAPL